MKRAVGKNAVVACAKKNKNQGLKFKSRDCEMRKKVGESSVLARKRRVRAAARSRESKLNTEKRLFLRKRRASKERFLKGRRKSISG